MDKCSVGILLESECHRKKLPCKKQALISVETLNNEERSVLHIRVAHEIQSECVLEQQSVRSTKTNILMLFHESRKHAIIYLKCTKNLFAI